MQCDCPQCSGGIPMALWGYEEEVEREARRRADESEPDPMENVVWDGDDIGF